MIDIKFGPQHRLELIHWAIKKVNAKSYLEIGCNKDEIFSNIHVSNKIGVDPFKGGNRRMTSDEFFSINQDRFDVVFVDGLHEYNQVTKDVDNSLSVLNKNGIVIIHDMLPRTEDQAAYPMPKDQHTWLGDVWKLAFDLTSRPDVNFNLVLIDQGCGVLTKSKNQNTQQFNLEHSWDYYKSNWKKLPLISFEEFVKL